MIKPGKDLSQLKNDFAAMNVVFKDDFALIRALIYYDVVKAIYDRIPHGDFKKDLASFGPEGYTKIQLVFADKNFLLGLCQILDRYIIDAINLDMKKRNLNYGQYGDYLLKNFPASISQFLSSFPRNAQALSKIASNYQSNILTACQRILTDWDMLQRLFVDTKQLNQLVAIESTGSDFHKGGQQVLILTFSLNPDNSTLKIIYKPSDLEVDCLIMGDTTALKRCDVDLFTPSLMEILNASDTKYPLPTYKILPRHPGSSLKPDNKGHLPIRDSYGYIEFLSYNGVLESIKNPDAICQQFYMQLGQITAVACTISLTDLHMENLIIHQHLPYLIDLETALIRPVTEVKDTSLLGQPINGGAIVGVLRDEQVAYVSKADFKQIAMLELYHPEKNRLWVSVDKVIAMQKYMHFLLDGFQRTCTLLGKLASSDSIQQWFARLQKGAIVRFIPAGSDVLAGILKKTYSTEQPLQSIEILAREEIGRQLKFAYSDWEAARKSKEITWQSFPLFLCIQDAYMLEDIANCDVPVFYHQLNTNDVLDSHGQKISTGGTITIDKVLKDIKALLGRETFFSSPPIKYIQEIQLASFSSDKINQLMQEVITAITPLQEQKAYDEAMAEAEEKKKRLDK